MSAVICAQADACAETTTVSICTTSPSSSHAAPTTRPTPRVPFHIFRCADRPYARELTYQSTETVSALHAGAKGVPFQQCNDTVGAQFVAPLSRPSIEFLPSLIERGVDVLLFAGMWDVRAGSLVEHHAQMHGERLARQLVALPAGREAQLTHAQMMCNWLGIERSIEQMTWGGKTGLVRPKLLTDRS